MKRILQYLMVVTVTAVAGCTKDFDTVNIDPTKSSEENFDPNYLFTSGQLDYGNVTEYQLYEIAPMVQVLASTFDYYGGGDKYNLFLHSYNTRFFTDGLASAAKLLEAQNLGTKKNPEYYSNLVQMSRIMWIMTMQRITDVYGDIPYSEAGRAKHGIQAPKYDRQEDIYKDMLAQLEDAIGKLDASKPIPTGDLYYDGDVEKWQKFGYSLMVRIAMRLTKIAPDMARSYVEKAAGKTFSDYNDNAVLRLDGASNQATQNKAVNCLLADIAQVRWSKTFIDHLNTNKDPRLYVLAEKPDTGLVNNEDRNKAGLAYSKTSPAPAGSVYETPLGMPNGYDLSGARAITTAYGYPGPTGTGSNSAPLGNYARPKRGIFAVKKNLPVFIITYGETELLLAEAAQRGWNTGKTAAQHYRNGVTGAMLAYQMIDGTLAIGADDMTKYVNDHPLDTDQEKALKMINSEYWVASLFDFVETWSNYRRSGYPVLTPVNYPGNITNASIPRRLTYPLSENANNMASYQEALQRLGGNDLPTLRVWWDKP